MKRLNGHAIIALVGALLLGVLAPEARAQMTDIQRGELRDVNLLTNPGAELGKVKWTASGGTFATTTTASNVGAGRTAWSWDASASSQTLTSAQETVKAGMYGKQCRAAINHKGGDANLTLSVIDGSSTLLASLVLATASTYTTDEVFFACPTSGTMALKLSAAADAAIVYFDQAFLGTLGQQPAVTISPVVYQQTKTAIVALGTSGFNAAGHTLAAADFPGTTADKIAFWNGDSAADDSGATACTSGAAACDLTNNGSMVFTGTGYAGASNTAMVFDGSNDYLNSTDAFFNPGNNKSFALGGWFAATDWTPAAAAFMISNYAADGSDVGFGIYLNTNGNIVFYASNTATSPDVSLSISSPGFTDASWHHFAAVYDASNDIWSAYIDGKKVGSQSLANQRSLTSSNFNIGRFHNGGGSPIYFTGKAQDVFFHNSGASSGALTDADIRKLAARKISTSKSVAIEDQLWTGNWYRSDSAIANQLSSSWVVDKTADTLYADFSDVAVGAYVDFAMQHLGQTGTVVPAKAYDSGWLSSTPSTSITHGLGQVPLKVTIDYETSSGNFEELPNGDWCAKTLTTLSCDWTGLTVDSDNRVRIRALVADTGVAVPPASLTEAGTVTADGVEQEFNGVKRFDDGIISDGGLEAVNLSATENRITTTTSDASDNASVCIGGGGTASESRGGYFCAYGNEHSGTGAAIAVGGTAADTSSEHAYEVWGGSTATLYQVVSGTGEVTAPQQPHFEAYNSVVDNPTSGVGVTVDFDTEVFDVGGDFASDTFTAPVTGNYLLCTGVEITAGSVVTRLQVSMTISGVVYYLSDWQDATGHAGPFSGGGCITKRMAATATATVNAFATGTSGLNIQSGQGATWFHGTLLN